MQTVLVTGAFGLVGRETVARLTQQGRPVVATDLDTAANRKAARQLPSSVRVEWADLTDEVQVEQLLEDAAPSAIVHLAAVIPAMSYTNVALAQRVNVRATESLVRVAEALPVRPRFVQASSVAVHGSRNPHRGALLRADSPTVPMDSYGQLKLLAEQVVMQSSLDWTVLRLGAVVSVDLRALPIDSGTMFLEWSLPVDGRINTVDVRDVASAFAAATTADVGGEVLLIGGDDTHRHVQGDLGPAMVAALGLDDCYPAGRPGDPADDSAWFVCDWMDTQRAQQTLSFQNHSWPQMLAEMRSKIGPFRHVLKLASPLVRMALARRSPYRGVPGTYADPWGQVGRRWPGAGLIVPAPTITDR
jgi:nucleoside-diphosphate-sugar epimerase